MFDVKPTVSDGNTENAGAQTTEKHIWFNQHHADISRYAAYETYEYKPLGPSLARILTKASKVFYKWTMENEYLLPWLQL